MNEKIKKKNLRTNQQLTSPLEWVAIKIRVRCRCCIFVENVTKECVQLIFVCLKIEIKREKKKRKLILFSAISVRFRIWINIFVLIKMDNDVIDLSSDDEVCIQICVILFYFNFSDLMWALCVFLLFYIASISNLWIFICVYQY